MPEPEIDREGHREQDCGAGIMKDGDRQRQIEQDVRDAENDLYEQ